MRIGGLRGHRPGRAGHALGAGRAGLPARRRPVLRLVALGGHAAALGRRRGGGGGRGRPPTSRGIDIALCSTGAGASRQIAPRLAAAGAVVIDNSSAWRMDPDVPLVVPEVNADALGPSPRASWPTRTARPWWPCPSSSPCTTRPGSADWSSPPTRPCPGPGLAGVAELARAAGQDGRRAQRAHLRRRRPSTSRPPTVFPAPIAHNVVPLAGRLVDDGSLETNEEQKYRNETRKILELPDSRVTCTCVRVPVFTGHSGGHRGRVRAPDSPRTGPPGSCSGAPGSRWSTCPRLCRRPGRDPSLVGRVRRAEGVDHGLALFVVGDNLRKGAALNAVQIAEALLRAPLLSQRPGSVGARGPRLGAAGRPAPPSAGPG